MFDTTGGAAPPGFALRASPHDVPVGGLGLRTLSIQRFGSRGTIGVVCALLHGFAVKGVAFVHNVRDFSSRRRRLRAVPDFLARVGARFRSAVLLHRFFGETAVDDEVF